MKARTMFLMEARSLSSGQPLRYICYRVSNTHTHTHTHISALSQALHYKKYSTASDVWSFGCLMYEIWSLGHKPFEGYTNPQVSLPSFLVLLAEFSCVCVCL